MIYNAHSVTCVPQYVESTMRIKIKTYLNFRKWVDDVVDAVTGGIDIYIEPVEEVSYELVTTIIRQLLDMEDPMFDDIYDAYDDLGQMTRKFNNLVEDALIDEVDDPERWIAETFIDWYNKEYSPQLMEEMMLEAEDTQAEATEAEHQQEVNDYLNSEGVKE